ncbi:MAG: hypothetical protein ACRC4W_01040 [Treponemataceae bacterium]
MIKSKLQFTFFQKILLGIVAFILFIILFGTIFVFLTKKAQIGSGLRKTDPSPEQIIKTLNKNTSIYSDIGQLRLVTADMPPITIILTPYFPYSLEDSAFYEEILQKAKKLKTIFFEYFAHRTKNELLQLGETGIKEEIIALINMEFVLGSISTIYFEDYLFLD